MEQVHGILAMTLFGKLWFFVLIIVSSSQTENWTNNFLELSEGPNYVIEGIFGSRKKNFSINFCKAKTKFYIIMVTIVTCLLTEQKYLSLKSIIKMSTF